MSVLCPSTTAEFFREPLAIGLQELSDLTGTNERVVAAFLETHAKGYRFFFGPGFLSVRVESDSGFIGAGMLPCPPYGRRYLDPADRRENWWFLLGYVIGLRQGGAL